MIRRFLSIFEPFILMLLGTVVLASLLPARGEMATIVGYAADIGIVLLFFLHGAKLSRDAIWAGLRNWKLHLAVLAITHPTLFERVPRHVVIETGGEFTRGMTVIDRRTLIERLDPYCDVLTRVDADAAFEVVIDAIAHFSR